MFAKSFKLKQVGEVDQILDVRLTDLNFGFFTCFLSKQISFVFQCTEKKMKIPITKGRALFNDMRWVTFIHFMVIFCNTDDAI